MSSEPGETLPWREYIDLAKTRDYSGDPAATDPRRFLVSLGINSRRR
jgi:hypothetical protein